MGNRLCAPVRGGQCGEVHAQGLHQRDGYGITDRCREYLYPLIEGEDYPPFEKGLPKYVTLKNVAVPKKLEAFEV